MFGLPCHSLDCCRDVTGAGGDQTTAVAAAATASVAAELTSVRASLSSAEARIEELLDEKSDMEYDLEVMERKLELLREEVGQEKTVWWGNIVWCTYFFRGFESYSDARTPRDHRVLQDKAA